MKPGEHDPRDGFDLALQGTLGRETLDSLIHLVWAYCHILTSDLSLVPQAVDIAWIVRQINNERLVELGYLTPDFKATKKLLDFKNWFWEALGHWVDPSEKGRTQ